MVRRAVVLAVVILGIAPAGARGAEAWLPPAAISPAGEDTNTPALAVDADGDVLVVWERGEVLEAVFRPAGGSFGAPVPVAEAGASLPTAADVAFGPGGVAHIVWTQGEGPIRRTWAAIRQADGTITDRRVVSAPGQYVNNPVVAVGPTGEVVAAWLQSDGTSRVGTAVRPAGGDWAEPVTLGEPGAGTNGIDLAFDTGGGTLLAWGRQLAGTGYVDLSTRPAGGAFGPPQVIAGPHDVAGAPSVAVEGDGTAVLAFAASDPAVVVNNPSLGKLRIFVASRPSGGGFGSPVPVSSTTGGSMVPEIAVTPGGEAVATWMQGFYPQAAIRPPGGAFGPQQRLSPADHQIHNGPGLTVDGAGRAHAVWSGSGAARYVTRPPGGAFTEMQTLSTVGINSNTQIQVAADTGGNAAALWSRPGDAGDQVELAGFDGAAPILRSVGFPTGLAGTPLPFSVDAVDVWSPVSVSWGFGDGTAGAGATTTHAYGAPGTYAAGVTATDALGNATSASGTVTVTPAPPAGTTPPDRLAPALTALRLSPARFRAAARGATLAAARVGTTVRFRLSEAATVRVSAERATSGRRVGRACRRTTKQNRRRARCTRYVTVKGSATRKGVPGANRFTFRGRLNGRALPVGRYRLVTRATDAAGNRGSVRRAAFRIVRR